MKYSALSRARYVVAVFGAFALTCGSTPLDPSARENTGGGGSAYPPIDAGAPVDAGFPGDAGASRDGGAGPIDAGARDAGSQPVDAGAGRTCGNRPGCTASGEYCKFAVGACPIPGSTGTCEPRPTRCRWEGDPGDRVCSCSGFTYPNACYAAMAGESVASYGTCSECEQDGDCTNGRYCEMNRGMCNDTPPYECPKRTCESCAVLSSKSDCEQYPMRCRWASGRCEGARATQPPTIDAGCVKGILDVCATLTDCGPGLICLYNVVDTASYCTKVCTTNTDCGGGGNVCVDSLCTRSCCYSCTPFMDPCAPLCGGGWNGLSCGPNNACGR